MPEAKPLYEQLGYASQAEFDAIKANFEMVDASPIILADILKSKPKAEAIAWLANPTWNGQKYERLKPYNSVRTIPIRYLYYNTETPTTTVKPTVQTTQEDINLNTNTKPRTTENIIIEDDIFDEQNKYISRYTSLDPVNNDKKQAEARAMDIATRPRDSSGNVSQGMEYLSGYAAEQADKKDNTLVGALRPQVISSTGEYQKYKQDVLTSGINAISEWEAREKARVDKYNKAMDEWEANGRVGYPPTATASEPKPYVDVSGLIVPGDIAEQAFTATAGDKVVESPLAWGMRMLSAPVSAGIGYAESFFTGKDAEQEAAKRVREGASLTGAGRDIGEATAEYFGLDKDKGRAIGFIIGLAADMVVPIDAGVISYGAPVATRTIGRVAGTAENIQDIRNAKALQEITSIPEPKEYVRDATQLQGGQRPVAPVPQNYIDALSEIRNLPETKPNTFNAEDLRSLDDTQVKQTRDAFVNEVKDIDRNIFVNNRIGDTSSGPGGGYSNIPVARIIDDTGNTKLANSNDVFAEMDIPGYKVELLNKKELVEQLNNSLKVSTGADILSTQGTIARQTTSPIERIKELRSLLSSKPRIQLAIDDVSNIKNDNILSGIYEKIKNNAANRKEPNKVIELSDIERDRLIQKFEYVSGYTEESGKFKQAIGENIFSSIQNAELTPRLWNEYIVKLGDAASARAQNISDVARVTDNIQTPQTRIASVIDNATNTGRVVARTIKNKTNKITEREFIRDLSSFINNRILEKPSTPFSKQEKEFVDAFNSRLSSVMPEFKAEMRSMINTIREEGNLKAGTEIQAEAFRRVVIDEFSKRIDNSGNIINSLNGKEELFKSWFRTMFGGYEQPRTIIDTFGKPKFSFTRMEDVSNLIDEGLSNTNSLIYKIYQSYLGTQDGINTLLSIHQRIDANAVTLGQLTGTDSSILPLFSSREYLNTVSAAYVNRKILNSALEELAVSNITPRNINSRLSIIKNDYALNMQTRLNNIVNGIKPSYKYIDGGTEIIFKRSFKSNNISPQNQTIFIETFKDGVKKIVDDIIDNNLTTLLDNDINFKLQGTIRNSDIYKLVQEKVLELHRVADAKAGTGQIAMQGLDDSIIKDIISSIQKTPAYQDVLTDVLSKLNKDRNGTSISKYLKYATKDKDFVGIENALNELEDALYASVSRDIIPTLRAGANVQQTAKEISQIKKFTNKDITLSVEELSRKFDNLDIPERQAYDVEQLMDAIKDKPGQIANIAKAGILSGFVLPNVTYHTANFMSAPLVIWQTLGGKAAIGSILRLTSGAKIVSKNIYKVANEVGKTIVLTTPNGRVYTDAMIADIVLKRNISQSNASAELSRSMFNEIAKWTARNTSGNLTGPVKNFFRQIDVRETINVYGEFANFIDTSWRTSVLVDALKAGKTEAEAIDMARRSLFDYASMTQLEKDYIAKAFWFYSFMRHSLVTAGHNILTNPSRAVHLYKISNGFETDRDFHVGTAEYLRSAPVLGILNTRNDVYKIYGPRVPMTDSVIQIIDMMSLFAIPFDRTKTVPERISDTTMGALTEYFAGTPPIAQTIMGTLAGKIVSFGEVRSASGTYLDPKLIALFKRNDDTWKAFTSIVNVEQIPDVEIRNYENVPGAVYRIRPKDEASKKTWFLLKQAMLHIGIQRAVKDYSIFFESSRNIVTEELYDTYPGTTISTDFIGLPGPTSRVTDPEQIRRGGIVDDLQR